MGDVSWCGQSKLVVGRDCYMRQSTGSGQSQLVAD